MKSESPARVRPAEEVIGRTQSVCPVCLKRVPARRVLRDGCVFLEKACREHGDFRAVIWRGPPDYRSWYQARAPEPPKACLTRTDRGCPFDCGLCPEHRQQICCALIEVTRRCDLRCPVCFASAGEDDAARDPAREELLDQLRMIWSTTGKCNIQLSGGEPTVRDDLPDIIREARALGYTFFQLNTNGLRLGEDPDYVRALAEAGLSTVFLQFDGTSDEVYRRLRGRALFQAKQSAIEACGRHRLGVVLVPTLVPGVNTDHIGDIVRYALKGMPVIRGVHLQPVSYFGRYPAAPRDEDRITLPEVLRALEEQTGGLLKAAHFAPSDCESSLCSFHGDFIYLQDGRLTPSGKRQEACCPGAGGRRAESVSRAQNFVARRWQMGQSASCCGPDAERASAQQAPSCCGPEAQQAPDRCGSGAPPPGQAANEQDSWDAILDRVRNYRLSITCMVYQDAGNMDLERLKYCCVPVIDGGRAVPFCAYNLTSRDGDSLYRGRTAGAPAAVPVRPKARGRRRQP